MPNKCVKCGKIHPDDADYLLKGCDVCGGKFFFYVSVDSIKKATETIEKLTEEEIKEIENDIREVLPEEAKKDEAIILDLESIRVVKPGKYEIDVTKLFRQRPIVIRIGSGKYRLDLSTLTAKRV